MLQVIVKFFPWVITQYHWDVKYMTPKVMWRVHQYFTKKMALPGLYRKWIFVTELNWWQLPFFIFMKELEGRLLNLNCWNLVSTINWFYESNICQFFRNLLGSVFGFTTNENQRNIYELPYFRVTLTSLLSTCSSLNESFET